MSHSCRRNRSIRDAISTSLVSKASSAVLQFGSLPLAARVLGREEFGIYATIAMSLFAVNLLQLGVGPAAAKAISEASARGDRGMESRIYLSGTLLVAGLGLLSVLVIALILVTVPIPVLFGPDYAPWTGVMVPALALSAFLFAGEFLAGFQDRVREGYMEASIVNAWAAGANLICAIAVVAGMVLHPSVLVLLIALFVPNILARFASACFMIRKRPYLLSGQGGPGWDVMKDLIRDGISYSATVTVVYVVEFNLCALLVGRLLGPGQVAIFQVLMTLAIAFVGLMIMVGTPTWAALADAKAHGDRRWMFASARSFYRFFWACMSAAAIGLIALGPWILEKWYGPEFATSRSLIAAFTLLLLALGWREVNYYLCFGLGKLHDLVRPILSGLVLGLVLGIAGLHFFGLWALFAGLAAGTLLIPGWILPALVWREVRPQTTPFPVTNPLLPTSVSSRYPEPNHP